MLRPQLVARDLFPSSWADPKTGSVNNERSYKKLGSIINDARLAGLVAMPVINAFRHRVDPARFNGASLLGLRGIVLKSHGSADAFAFEQALARAYDAARNRLLDRVHDRIVATLESKTGADAGDNATTVAQAA